MILNSKFLILNSSTSMLFLPALILGLFGSLHCAGMCGPIAMAVPLKNNMLIERIFSSFLYNFGRAVTYALLGLAFGLIGQGFALSGWQRWISIAIGAIMILSIIFPAIFKSKVTFEKGVFRYIGKLKSGLGKLFQIRSYPSLFAIGILNGFLPCGLVYAAIGGSIATFSALNGALFMFIFGLGTFPMLISISLIGSILTQTIRQKLQKLVPFVIVLFGILFILRGLTLGIPYISPLEKRLHLEVKKEKTIVTDSLPPCCR